MRRPWLLLLVLVFSAGPLWGQARVRLEVTASEPINPQGVRRPQVRTPGILQDPRWRDALQNSFPLRLRYRVEIWRVRPDWFDALERAFEWETLVQFEPLTDQFTKTVVFGGSARAYTRFTSLQELERDLERVQLVTITPAGIGEYYFTGSLQIRTLTDAEMEELERFLQGEPSPRDQPDDAQPSFGRTARRLLLRFGGLPYQELEGRTARFQVSPPRDPSTPCGGPGGRARATRARTAVLARAGPRSTLRGSDSPSIPVVPEAPMRRSWLMLPMALLLLAGCDEKFLVIESDTSWEGEIRYLGEVGGNGNAEIDLSDEPADVCWTLRKTTAEGTLRAYLRDETWFGLGEEVDGDQTTTAAEGEVTGCNE